MSRNGLGTLVRCAATGLAVIASLAPAAALAQSRPLAGPTPSAAPATDDASTKADIDRKLRLATQPNPPTPPIPPGLRGPAPVNDECAGAITIPATTTIIADTATATTNPADPTFYCKFGTGDLIANRTLWYRFIATHSTAQIKTCGTTQGDSILAVFRGGCGALNTIDCNDDSIVCANNSFFSLVTATGLIPGEAYLICVGNYGLGAGAAFTLEIASPAPAVAAGNDCASAVFLLAGFGYQVETALSNNASTPPLDPTPTCVTPIPAGNPVTDGTVWFHFEAISPSMTVSGCGASAGDSILTAYSGSCDNLTQLACSDAACGTQGRLSLSGLTVGAEYLVMVAHKNRTLRRNNYSLLLTATPPPVPNDTCATATPVAVPSSGVYSAAGASPDTGLPCGGANPTGVWFTLTGTGRAIGVSTCSAATTFDTKLSVFSGACGSLTCIDSSTAAVRPCVPASAAALTFCSVQGATYYVLVSGEGVDGGAFALAISDLALCPTNDTCVAATPLAIGRSIVANNTLASPENGLPACHELSDFPCGVWFQAVGNGRVLRASTCNPGTLIDTSLSIYAGSCAAPRCIDASEWGSPPCTSFEAAAVEFCSVSGQTYFILVTSPIIDSGQFEVSLEDVRPCVTNDLCAGAISLAVPSVTTVSTEGATTDAAAPGCAAPPAPPNPVVATGLSGVWYHVFGNGNRFAADTCTTAGGSFDTRITVYCGQGSSVCTNLEALACITASDNATQPPPDGCGPLSQQSRAEWCTQAGAPYLIHIHGGNGVQGSSGPATLTLTDLGPCASAVTCAPRGACCTAGTACALTTQAACAGSYLGDGSACFPPTGSPATFDRAPNLAIPDNQCEAGFAADSVTVPSSFTIADVNISVSVPNHTFIGDLRIDLVHGPVTVRLWRNQCLGNDGLSVAFDDEGSPVVCAQPTTGVYRPLDPLSAFDGLNAAGPWTLRVCDSGLSDTGTLASWSLSLTPAGPNPCATAGPDCFTRGAAGSNGPCGRPTHARPVAAQGHFTRGGPDGADDTQQCIGDWDGDGCIVPADVATFIATWFFSAQTPGNTHGDIDCSGAVNPADVATFVVYWFTAVQNPGSQGC